jgi:hypothetical protein
MENFFVAPDQFLWGIFVFYLSKTSDVSNITNEA